MADGNNNGSGPPSPFSDLANALLGGPNYVDPQSVTPAQMSQMYAYSNELLKPQPVNNWAQGLGEIARALVGGEMAHRANVQGQAAVQNAGQQYANTVGALDSPARPSPVAPPGAPPQQPPMRSQPPGALPIGQAPAPAGSSQDPAAVSSYVAQAAAARGIDPNIATKMFTQESSMNPGAVGDDNSSFGVPQLHYGGVSKDAPNPGMGDAFTKATGLDARDPANWQKTVDFALDSAKTQGWAPWANTRNKLGIGNYTGIGQSAQPPAGAPPAGPPAGPAPTQPGAPQPGGNGLPVSAQQIGALLANPWISDAEKATLQAQLAPKTYEDALHNTYLGYQNQPVQQNAPPVFAGGIHRVIDPQHPTADTLTTGTPGAPASNVVVPTVGGQPPAGPAGPTPGGQSPIPPGGLAGLISPGGAFYPSIAQGQANEARGAAVHAVGATSGTQYATDLANASRYQQIINPLVQAIPRLEALGKTGTGPGTDERNQIVSFLQSAGMPGIDPAKIQNFDEANKYLTDYVNQNGNTGTNDKLAASFAGNPSTHISNAAAVDVAKTALTLQRMKEAQIKLFSQANGSPEQYSQHALNFSSSQDPRAYGVDMMSPQSLKALSATLPYGSPERQKFLQSLQNAHAAGVMQ